MRKADDLHRCFLFFAEINGVKLHHKNPDNEDEPGRDGR